MKRVWLVSLVVLLISSRARALPQFSVVSAGACDSCHVQPAGWDNPEVRLRRCSLGCNNCHVNPTGGGLKNAGGLFFGRRVVPLFGSDFPHGARELDPQGRPVNPMNRVQGAEVPAPNTAARFDGIVPNPAFQVGADVRGMVFFAQLGKHDSQDVFAETRVFPMQADLYAAFRPYNPPEHNQGRVTLYASAGAVGQRFYREDFTPDLQESLRVRELFALYDDLPHQLYVKAGRFIPAFGWRLDDHTAYIRQEQGFDQERWVHGIEVGLNPNYPYANFSVYRFEPDRFTFGFSEDDKGFGSVLSVGTRHLDWQVGASALIERRDRNNEVMAGVQWSLNLSRARHPWKTLQAAPLVYLGELDVRSIDPKDAGTPTHTGLTTFHELDWLLRTGLRLMARFDWQDTDLDAEATHRQRYTIGAVANLLPWVELIAQYRRNAGFAETFNFVNPNKKHEAILQVHLWY
jgi:hypothetical protein